MMTPTNRLEIHIEREIHCMIQFHAVLVPFRDTWNLNDSKKLLDIDMFAHFFEFDPLKIWCTFLYACIPIF